MEEQIGQEVRLKIEFQAFADHRLRIEQLGDVGRAADRGQLLIADVEIITVEGHGRPMLE